MIGLSMLLGKLQHLMSSKKSRLTTLFTYVCLSKFIISLTSKQTSGLKEQRPKTSKVKAFIERFWQLTIISVALLPLSSLSYAELSSAVISDQTAISGELSGEKAVELSAAKSPEVLTQKTTLTTRWNTIESSGKNHSVYFHAWGGDPQINSYIQGQVDLVWINGENFASMAQYQLLAKDWVVQLPNFSLTNPDDNEAMTRDFGLPTQGMEAPWGQASLTFYYTPTHQSNKFNFAQRSYQESIQHAPKDVQQLLTWAEQNPGRFTYPKPPDFLSLSFLKYALIALNQFQTEQIKSGLYQAVTPLSQAALLPVLWRYLDKLHPHLWHQGQYFVASGTALQRLVGDGEINLGFTFSAAQIPASVARYNLPENTRSFVMQDGSLSNIHFVAIPYNAANSNSAKVVANFMLSVEAQAKKQQAEVWGDSTVIDVSQLPSPQQLLFSTNKQSPSALPISSKIKALSEPHPSWSKLISREWLKRYGAQ